MMPMEWLINNLLSVSGVLHHIKLVIEMRVGLAFAL